MLDVVRALAHVLELLVQDVRSLGGSLGVCGAMAGASQLVKEKEGTRDGGAAYETRPGTRS